MGIFLHLLTMKKANLQSLLPLNRGMEKKKDPLCESKCLQLPKVQ